MIRSRGQANWSAFRVLVDKKIIRYWNEFDTNAGLVCAYEEDAQGNLIPRLTAHFGVVEIEEINADSS